jgi:AAA family ATP:ADP antiporter
MPRGELARVGGVSALAFVILASYAVARPATESLFLEAHGSARLPWAWLAVATAASVTALVYRRACARLALPRLLSWALLASGAVLVALLALRRVWTPGATFLLYCWKDVYIVVLIEILWSIANAVFRLATARWAYGLFCVAGSLGGIAANLSVGHLSRAVGTASALWAALPILAAAGGLGAWLAPVWGLSTPAPAPASASGRGTAVVRRSRTLLLLLGLIAVVQVVVTLVDYQFNATMEAALRDVDARTAAIGRVYATIDAGSMVLQLATGPILRALGLRATLLAIPVLLGAAVSAFALSPRTLTISIAKVGSKVFDYSLFRAAKEILYLPLSYAEKTEGKAVVDILTYRISKAGASLVLLALAASAVTPTALGLLLAWLALTEAVTRKATGTGGAR